MRFTLRTALILVALAAVGFGVFESQTRDWRERRRITLKVASYGGSVLAFDKDNNVTWISIHDQILSPKIARFDTLQHLYCAGSNITDDNLRQLQDLRRVMILHLNDTRVSNAGLFHLAEIGEITVLRLNRTDISDAGMDALAAINIVRGVDLSGTRVTRKGVEYLRSKRPGIYVLQRGIGSWGDDKTAEPSDVHGT